LIGRQFSTGLSDMARDLINKSWRDSSKKTYDSYIKQWRDYATELEFDYLQPSEVQIGNFLSFLFQKGLSYSAIKAARAAISSITISDYSDSRLLRRIMKGVFEERPQLQKNVTWNVKKVLDYLKTRSPARRLSVMELTMKTVILILLVIGQRNQSVHLVDVRNVDIKYDRITLRWGDKLKVTRPGFHQGEVIMKAYKDKRICPVWYMKEYLKRTNKYRTKNNLFLITQKPYGPATQSTIARWVRRVLVEAGINMSIFTPHSVRSAATSAMKKARVPLSTILATAGWSSEKTFAKYYNKDIIQKEVSVKQYL